METCLACQSLSGEKRISPGPSLFDGRYWVVEHAYPVKMTGWLVIVLKRHAEALHNLSDGEFEELAALQKRCAQALHEAFGCANEYSICLAEKEGFKHIHFHVVARAPDLPEALRGTNIYQMLKATEVDALPRAEIKAFCEELQRRFALPAA
jgi:diadenosine tetraphosphate (Ap4A) HIT family hydrolase